MMTPACEIHKLKKQINSITVKENEITAKYELYKSRLCSPRAIEYWASEIARLRSKRYLARLELQALGVWE